MIWALLAAITIGIVSFLVGLIMGALTGHVTQTPPPPQLHAVPDEDAA